MIRIALIFSFLAANAVAQSAPKCPETHYPCGGKVCCEK